MGFAEDTQWAGLTGDAARFNGEPTRSATPSEAHVANGFAPGEPVALQRLNAALFARLGVLSAPPLRVNVQEFTANGTYARVSSTLVVFQHLLLIGGGRSGLGGSTTTGGYGGSSGLCLSRILSGDQLGATAAIVVGAGGVPGLTQSDGGDSTVTAGVLFLKAIGGKGTHTAANAEHIVMGKVNSSSDVEVWDGLTRAGMQNRPSFPTSYPTTTFSGYSNGTDGTGTRVQQGGGGFYPGVSAGDGVGTAGTFGTGGTGYGAGGGGGGTSAANVGGGGAPGYCRITTFYI